MQISMYFKTLKVSLDATTFLIIRVPESPTRHRHKSFGNSFKRSCELNSFHF